MTEVIWEGAEELRPWLRPVDELIPTEGNPRKGDVFAIAGSLKRFGQVKGSVTINEENKITAGHHVRLAAIELGWTHIAAIPAHFESEDERIAYLMADNRLSQLGGYDEQSQLTILEDLEQKGKLEGTGFDSDAIEDMRSAMAQVATTTPPETWGGGFTENAADAEERATAIGNYRAMREIVLMVEPEKYEEVATQLRTLSAIYGTDGTIATFLEALNREAGRYGEQDESVPEPAVEPTAEPVAGVFIHEGQTSLVDDEIPS